MKYLGKHEDLVLYRNAVINGKLYITARIDMPTKLYFNFKDIPEEGLIKLYNGDPDDAEEKVTWFYFGPGYNSHDRSVYRLESEFEILQHKTKFWNNEELHQSV